MISVSGTQRTLGQFAVLVVAVSVVACRVDDAPGPTRPTTQVLFSVAPPVADLDSAPFYYYFKEKVPLVVDPSQFVIATDEGATDDAVRDHLEQVGLDQNSVTRLSQVKNHWTVLLPGQRGASAARTIAQSLRARPGIVFAEPLYRFPGSTDWMRIVNRVVVKFRADLNRADLDAFMSRYKLTLERPPRPEHGHFTYWFAFLNGGNGRALAAAAQLNEDSGVEWAGIDQIVPAKPTFIPSDPFYPLQKHLKTTTTYNGVRVDINVESAWDVTKGYGIKIAIIGDGVDIQHNDYSLNGGQWWDAVNDGPPRCEGTPIAPEADDNHETQVMGIIAGKHNANGIAGIVPDAIINVVRWYCTGTPPNFRIATAAQLAYGINWAWSWAGSDVLSNSWVWHASYGPSPQVTDAINNAVTYGRGGKGTVVVFSSGNNFASVVYPASLPNVVAVGAIRPTGPRANYSSFGPELDIVAPSGDTTSVCVGSIVTTDRFGSPGCNNGPPGGVQDYTQTFSGTSAAAPQVAAVAAMILARQPTLTQSVVRSRLCLADPWGPANEYGCGKLNAQKALAGFPLSGSIAGPSPVRQGNTCRWSIAVTGGIPSYLYAWAVNGGPQGTNSAILDYSHPTSQSFIVSVLVTDSFTPPNTMQRTKNVTVSPTAPQCQPQ